MINNQPKPQEMTGHVNIHYVDEDGEPLRPQVSLPSRTWLESEATPEYQTLATPLYLTSIEKDGEIYVLDESKIPTNADGSYIAGQTVDVTYVYKLQQTKLSSPTINDKHKIKASADTLFLEKSTASVNLNKKDLNDAELPKTSEANQWKLSTLGGLTLISLVCLFMLKQKR
ncbi:MucBP domain-containing protein [Lactococcus petauri]|uniref:MucBP domain-containing protein n=1 Tax=Lactococcus petauri TaxID=1940789 RepID=UPI001BCE7850|nr:MucBP domain-containing protein [Lactococcus petauri]MBS4460891.1 MucBP domain-containing protein [Lactococcus petauri]